LRELALKQNKILIVPTPKLKKGFLLLEKVKDPKFASTIRGMFKFGRLISINKLPKIEFMVEGSLACSLEGVRIGKSEGFSDLEFAILLEYKKIEKDIKIATTVSEIQIFEKLPYSIHDVCIDLIATPKRLIRISRKIERPDGIIKEILDSSKIKQIPLLSKWSL